MSSERKELIPSKELQKAIQELDYMESEEYKTFSSVEELMEDLNSEEQI